MDSAAPAAATSPVTARPSPATKAFRRPTEDCGSGLVAGSVQVVTGNQRGGRQQKLELLRTALYVLRCLIPELPFGRNLGDSNNK